jgi:hypothetical protein
MRGIEDMVNNSSKAAAHSTEVTGIVGELDNEYPDGNRSQGPCDAPTRNSSVQHSESVMVEETEQMHLENNHLSPNCSFFDQIDEQDPPNEAEQMHLENRPSPNYSFFVPPDDDLDLNPAFQLYKE